jgi:hypothetical protein
MMPAMISAKRIDAEDQQGVAAGGDQDPADVQRDRRRHQQHAERDDGGDGLLRRVTDGTLSLKLKS